MNTTQFISALDAQQRGWHIFPCQPGDKRGAIRGNGPYRIKWYDVATNDLATIVTWWKLVPEFNIGISCKKSGLLVVDCDVLNPDTPEATEDGMDQFKRLCENRGGSWAEAMNTYVVETPSLGVHAYYRWPDNVKASQRSLDSLLDVRTNGGEKGGYVVGAGSRTERGEYTTINKPAQVAPCPSWLVNECTAPPYVPPLDLPFTRPLSMNFAGLHRQILDPGERNRNNSLYWSALKMSESYHSCTEEEVYEEFVDDALHVGLTEREIRATVHSAYTKVRNHAP